MKTFSEEVINLITKTLIPAFVAVSISIAVVVKKKGKVTVLSAFLSYVIGMGLAFIFGPYLIEHLESEVATIVIGLIAMSGEKIGNWLVFTFRIDEFLTILSNLIKAKIEKWFS